MCRISIDKMLAIASSLCGMKYNCKSTGMRMDCIKSIDMRKSWIQDGGLTNIKRVAWIFHFFPFSCYSAILNKSHSDLAERKIMKNMQIQYENGHTMTRKHVTCIKQTYSKQLNEKKVNMIRKYNGNKNKVEVRIMRPRDWQDPNHGQNYNRKKQEFYIVQYNELGQRKVTMVSSVIRNKLGSVAAHNNCTNCFW